MSGRAEPAGETLPGDVGFTVSRSAMFAATGRELTLAVVILQATAEAFGEAAFGSEGAALLNRVSSDLTELVAVWADAEGADTRALSREAAARFAHLLSEGGAVELSPDTVRAIRTLRELGDVPGGPPQA